MSASIRSFAELSVVIAGEDPEDTHDLLVWDRGVSLPVPEIHEHFVWVEGDDAPREVGPLDKPRTRTWTLQVLERTITYTSGWFGMVEYNGVSIMLHCVEVRS